MRPIALINLCSRMGIHCDEEEIVTGICVDSRLLKNGDLFFALPGEKVDGHAFISQAEKVGASAIVVSRRVESSIPQVVVEDTLEALQHLARRTQEGRHSKVIGITGSNGKTTTKEFCADLLRAKLKVAATPRSYNGQIGFPLSVMSFDGDEDAVVLEMGMSDKGEIQKLTTIVPPDIAAIVNVNMAHVCFFETLEDVSMAKAEILSHPKTKLGILNRDMPHYDKMKLVGTCEKVTFSTEHSDADFYLKHEMPRVQIFHQGSCVLEKELPVAGIFSAENFIVAAIAAYYSGISWDDIAVASEELCLPPRRFERKDIAGVSYIDDTYNASSVKAVCLALDSLPKPKRQGRRIAVLGELLEYGEYTQQANVDVAKHALETVDSLLCYGKGCLPMVEVWQEKGRDVELYQSHDELLEAIRHHVREDDVVILKGGRTCALEDVMDQI